MNANRFLLFLFTLVAAGCSSQRPRAVGTGLGRETLAEPGLYTVKEML